MTKSELTKYLDEHYTSARSFNARSKKHRDAYASLLHHTAFMDDVKGVCTSARVKAFRLGMTEVPECDHPDCENDVNLGLVPVEGKHIKWFTSCCSVSCSRSNPNRVSKARETMNQKYGGHNMQTEKGQAEYKKSIRAKYGVDNPNQHEDVKARSKATRENWTTEQKAAMVESRKSTWESRYGGHPMHNPEVVSKLKTHNMEKYGRESHTQCHIPDWVMEILSSKDQLQSLYDQHGFLSDVANHLGVHFSSVQRACARLGVEVSHRHMQSRGELEICGMLDSWGIHYEQSVRSILSSGHEIDIFIPSMNIGIEYNGVHWHSEVFRDKKYHQNKALDAMEKGIQLIQVWEDDWKDERRKEIMIKKIKAKLGIDQQRVFARKTDVVYPTAGEANAFFETNHIQGHVSCRTIGLEHNGELVAVMGMKRIGDETNGEWDLVRYATSKNVVGGLSKLLSHFKRSNTVKHILTYAHLDYSHGKAYEAVGFTKEHVTVAGMFYVKGENRHRREKFMKHKLPELLENFDPELTERENMEAHGFKRLYDCGSIKYTWQA